MRRFISIIVLPLVVLPLVLGGCGPVFYLYLHQVERAHHGPDWRPQPRPDPLADRPVAITGPVAVTLGTPSALAPVDNRHLLDGLAAYLHRRFPQAAIGESRRAPSATVLEVTTTRDTSDAHPAVVHMVVRVYDGRGSLQSVIRVPAIAVELKQADRTASIDAVLTGLTGKLDTLLRP
ncbi:MAG: hypothetical protein ACK4JB_15950 [Reyranella sp.]